MRNRHLLILVVALLVSPAAAQQADWRQPEDHLEPKHPALSSHYDLLLHDRLHKAYDASVDVSMVALPSFVPEHAVVLRSFETTGTGAFKTVGLGAPYHQRDSATGMLAALANAMRDLCEKKATMGELDLLTTELQQRLRMREGR